jgi:Ca-activated chloride channel family protein
MIRFASWYFLLLIPLIIYIFAIRRKKSALKFSSVKLLEKSGLKKTIKHRIGRYCTTMALILLAVALARPQLDNLDTPVWQKGIDIAIVLDVSGSMESVDMEPSRLDAALETIDAFIEERPNDRISLIIFAGTAYTRIPLTLDHNVIRESLRQVNTSSVNEDGTAIGTAIAVGLNRLKKSDAASKIMLLVTDGENNAGVINPTTASELAGELGVKVYTIGVGTDRTIIPVNVYGQIRYQQYEGGLDEELLKQIAEMTGGQYYRARDSKALSRVFSSINQLEKTEFEQDNFKQYTELAYVFIKIGLMLLAAGVFLERLYFILVP